MKLISQIGTHSQGQPESSRLRNRLRTLGRRIPWSAVGWCLLAIATASIALYAVHTLAHMVQAAGANT